MGQQEAAAQEQQTQQQEAPAEPQQQEAPAEPQQQEAPAQPQQQEPVQEQPVEQPAPQVAASGETYTVQSGDTLNKIATEQGVDGGWRALFELNADQISDPTLIFPGQELAL